MGRRDLIGSGPRHLIPARQPSVALTVENSGVLNGRRVAAPKDQYLWQKTSWPDCGRQRQASGARFAQWA